MTVGSTAATKLLRRCWATLGLALPDKVLDERQVGLVDPEALLLVTLIWPGGIEARLAENLLPFCMTFQPLLHYERLAALTHVLPEAHRTGFLGAAREAGLDRGSRRLAAALGMSLTKSTGKRLPDTRKGRIRLPEDTAALCAFVSRRLMFGTGYRADLVALTALRGHGLNGRGFARLLATSPSTVSRIMRDLRACEFVDKKGRRQGAKVDYPGMIVSADTLRNLVAIIDAGKLRDPKLAKEATRECDFEWDRLGATLCQRGQCQRGHQRGQSNPIDI